MCLNATKQKYLLLKALLGAKGKLSLEGLETKMADIEGAEFSEESDAHDARPLLCLIKESLGNDTIELSADGYFLTPRGRGELKMLDKYVAHQRRDERDEIVA